MKGRKSKLIAYSFFHITYKRLQRWVIKFSLIIQAYNFLLLFKKGCIALYTTLFYHDFYSE